MAGAKNQVIPVVSQQPRQNQQSRASKSASQKTRWSTKVLDCTADMPVCICGWCFGPLLACQLAKRYDESCCLPFLPGGVVALRTKMRQKYNIEGNILDDAMASFFPCTLCQMAREYKARHT
ncbi:cornifelin homolog B-like [Engraulis encrasicolus]|uniref:cornifelin homolog B-like n=1 Tax=Engraulis encrasicolus TaxID=184585 RepID=UPI002FCF0026